MGVKNKGGGNKAKKQGRKHVVAPQKKKVRCSEDPLEVYASCQKKVGGGHIHVMCIDGKTRLCVIRAKFRGRHKGDNRIDIGTWLLIGLRDFQTNKDPDKMEVCDLLEVYREGDKDDLKQREPDKNWKTLLVAGVNASDDNILDDDVVEFINSTESTILPDDLPAEDKPQENTICLGDGEEIDFDDI